MVDAWVSIHGRGVTNPAPILPSFDPARIEALAVPEDLLWRISTHLRVLAGLLLSGEVRAEVAADQAAVFALLTEAPHAPV